MYILLNDDNYILACSQAKFDDRCIEVEEQEFEYDLCLYKYEDETISLDETKKAQYDYDNETETLRKRRQTECFEICDRACWYDTLTQAQKDEVKQWRSEWLQVTETRVIPTKPPFIENS